MYMCKGMTPVTRTEAIMDPERFDAAFWSLSPHEAAIMDPQHRLFLEVAWQAFEHAEYAPLSGTPERTAVVAAPGIDGYMHHHLDGAPLKDALDGLILHPGQGAHVLGPVFFCFSVLRYCHWGGGGGALEHFPR